ncbi:dinitrogenase iron-molybdenum cofactor biosynthesis protein [Methanoculleus sp. FWC-SCC1]|uniref:Dinitrogenase iron-molybdenum cofactor biosynthesis protein n=1 Tax=Methanoculleus frigidifontis TaxID=2584085 RepID=A0ABT8M5Y2_9EURY|nr:NifB/NifX family molybdenum-iron cluster-binding protein [Methanoculleus sp. FWC-SCC1]MDN7023350.1 dinitrogenase iron-molybdenum cofactor biosynthesis protein [Methanoculleus sp. FWC-SCC1]
MKIAIAKEGTRVSEHFGHCEGYAIYRIENSTLVREDDLASPGHEPGRLPAFLHEHGVDLVIAGGMGPRAVEIFTRNGIEVILGVSGAVDSAAEEYAAGSLAAGESSCHHGHESCDGTH